jgi:hypothetical protein
VSGVNFADIKVGDRIRATPKNPQGVTVEGVVSYADDELGFYSSGNAGEARFPGVTPGTHTFERVAPPIPTADGVYRDGEGDLWVIHHGRRGLLDDVEGEGGPLPERYGPYELLYAFEVGAE